MILLVGLGNPGKKYQNNRHNVGHMFVDFLTNHYSLDTSQFRLVKTDCFMNESGIFFKNTLHVTRFTLQSLIVVHDDLDIPFGKFHIQKGVGPQLHNGLKSIEENLRSKDFWRVRIGVDARLPNRWIDGESYVLQNFLTEEKIRLEKEIFPIILNQLKIFLKTTFSIIF
jgi:PTH1 family peptidyl-tRNA hydrolase